MSGIVASQVNATRRAVLSYVFTFWLEIDTFPWKKRVDMSKW